jgi:ABC-type amino acid transport substrate-binding protein
MASHFTKKYTDDLGGLLEKHYIRVLTTFNKTNYFLSGTKQYGFEYSLLKGYEEFLNKGKKRRDLKVVMEFIPVSRDQLIPALVSGYGDIAAAGLTITPERLKEVDFTDPYLSGIDEVIVAK